MFEKEAKNWVKEHTEIDYKASYGEFPIEPSATKSFKAGAEFGYNKANLKLRNCMNCKHRDTKGHSSCKDKGIVLCSHWEVKE